MHFRTSLDPVAKYDVTIGNHVACKLETGSGQDKTQFTPHCETGQTVRNFQSQTVMTCHQFSSHREHRQDKTRLSCPVGVTLTLTLTLGIRNNKCMHVKCSKKKETQTDKPRHHMVEMYASAIIAFTYLYTYDRHL